MTVAVRLVDREGTVLASFTDGARQVANVSQVAWVLNQPGSARFTVPVFHPSAAAVGLWTTEVQILRDDEVVWWGIPVQRRYAGGGRVEFACVGLLGYFAERFFGPITRNYLANPRFESSLSSWVANGPTAIHSTAMRIRGPGTAELHETAGDQDSYLSQTFTVDTGPLGLYIEVAAAYWIDPASTFEPALEQRGLAVLATNSAQGFEFAPITNSSPIGEIDRLVTGINLLPNLTDEPVEVRLYCPRGTIRWGDTIATVEESLSSHPDGVDATEMMRRIAAYVHERFDYNIAATAQPPSGVNEVTAYQFKDLPNVLRTLETYPERGIADFDVVYTDTERFFATWAPQRGTNLSASISFTVPGSDILGLEHLIDATQAGTEVIVRGPGSGASRAIGWATDTSGLGGLVLQKVTDIDPDLPLDALDQIAPVELNRVKDLVEIPDIDVAASRVFGEFWLGDTISVDIDWGAVQDSIPRRVVQLVWHPANDTMSVGVN